MPFSPNALSPSSSCRCSCMHDLQHVQKPQRLAERSGVEHRDLVCALFLIRAGLVQNEVRVDGWLDQQKRQISAGISTADPVTGRLWNIKIKTERKSFKGSARASPTVAGHAFTPPATVTRISTFDNAHEMSRHRREGPASHVEGSFQIFFKNWNWNVQPVLKWKILGEAAVPASNGGQRLKKLARCSVGAWYSPEKGVLRYERPKEETTRRSIRTQADYMSTMDGCGSRRKEETLSQTRTRKKTISMASFSFLLRTGGHGGLPSVLHCFKYQKMLQERTPCNPTHIQFIVFTFAIYVYNQLVGNAGVLSTYIVMNSLGGEMLLWSRDSSFWVLCNNHQFHKSKCFIVQFTHPVTINGSTQVLTALSDNLWHHFMCSLHH